MTVIVDNLKKIQENIKLAAQKSGRQSKEIQIIAVTKQVTITRAQEALSANLLNLGENRPEGLLEKIEVIKNKAIWHYIGSLQTRKVRFVIDQIDYLHSLDRISLAQEIEKRASSLIKCFVQVNVSEEESKHGLSSGDTMAFIEELAQFEKIEVVGLMTMAPNTTDDSIIRSTFKSLKKLQQEVAKRNFKHAPCKEVSMGMSNDYEIAVEEGATFVRIGTALVGNEGSVDK